MADVRIWKTTIEVYSTKDPSVWRVGDLVSEATLGQTLDGLSALVGQPAEVTESQIPPAVWAYLGRPDRANSYALVAGVERASELRRVEKCDFTQAAASPGKPSAMAGAHCRDLAMWVGTVPDGIAPDALHHSTGSSANACATHVEMLADVRLLDAMTTP